MVNSYPQRASIIVGVFLFILSCNFSIANDYVSAMAMGSIPKYKEPFVQFDYTDKFAKKGGELRLAAMGTYDKLKDRKSVV